MNRLPKFLFYVYELPYAFVGRISQAEVILRCRPQEKHETSLLSFLNRKIFVLWRMLSTMQVSVYLKYTKATNSAQIHGEPIFKTSRE